MSPLVQDLSIPGTPSSQISGSQLSDSLSPVDLKFANRNSTSPGSGDYQALTGQHLSLNGPSASTPSVTSLRDGKGQVSQSSMQQMFPDSSSPAFSQSTLQSFENTSPQNQGVAITPTAGSSDKGISPPVAVSMRHESADSSSETSDTGRSKAERPEPARTRTTDSAKVRHNIVERRYRENINAQVDVLRDSIVATMQVKDEQNGTSSSRLGADELKRLTKAAVIAAATQQIKRARSENDKLLDEHRILQAQIKDLEKRVKCGECPVMQLSVDMGLDSPS